MLSFCFIFGLNYTFYMMDWYSLSDPAIRVEVGERLKEYRLRKNLTQNEVAVQSGLSVLSVQNLENGRSVSLSTFVPVLRVLRLLPNLENLVPELPISPVELLKLKGKSRQRAGKSSRIQRGNGSNS